MSTTPTNSSSASERSYKTRATLLESILTEKVKKEQLLESKIKILEQIVKAQKQQQQQTKATLSSSQSSIQQEELGKQVLQLQADLKSSSSALEQTAKRYEMELSKLQKEMEEKGKQQKAVWERERRGLVSEWKEKLRKKVSSSQKELQRISQQHALEIQELRADLLGKQDQNIGTLQERHQIQVAALKSEIVRLDESFEKNQQEWLESKAKVEKEWQSTLVQLQQEQRQHNTTVLGIIQQHEKQTLQQQLEFNTTLLGLKKEYEQSLESLEQELLAELEQVEQARLESVTIATASVQAAQNRETEWKQKYDDNLQQYTRLKAELERLEDELKQRKRNVASSTKTAARRRRSGGGLWRRMTSLVRRRSRKSRQKEQGAS